MTEEISNSENYARRELKAAGWYAEDAMYGDMIPEAVLELVRVFAGQGHSGMSANIVRGIFNKLAMWEPLVPLSGDDDEWNEVGPGIFQNNRCSRVFKEGGEAYDIDGRVFREPSGSCYTSRGSRVAVAFPYTPKTEYVDVDAAE